MTDADKSRRARAETAVKKLEAELRSNVPATSPQAAQEVLHELRVHEIELEMQNDELRLAQAELSASRASYMELYEHAPVGYCTLDLAGVIRQANQVAGEIAELRSDALIAQPLSRFLSEADADIFYLAKRRLEQTSEAQSLELQIGSGTAKKWIQLVLSLSHGDAGAILLCAMTDISALKLAEEALERLNSELEARVLERTALLHTANEELIAFSYTVSHDLRTPLRGIAGFANLLGKLTAPGLAAEPAQHYLSRIQAGVIQMDETIEALLVLTKAAHGDLHWDEVDLSALVEKSLNELREREPDRPVSLTVQPGLIVRGDRRLLQEVVDNLVGNAWKFSGNKPRTCIDFRGELRASNEMVYVVRDEGAGFDHTYSGKLFSPFQRLHDAADFPGSGIGLATVKKIVERHGGRVWAESQLGEATAVYFTLGATAAPH